MSIHLLINKEKKNYQNVQNDLVSAVPKVQKFAIIFA